MKKVFVIIIILIAIFLGLVFWFAQNKNTAYNENADIMNNTDIKTDMKIESSAFVNGGNIPARFTCDGEGINPDLAFKNVPKESKSLALIMDDPDAPMGTWIHWVVFNMPPETEGIDENSTPDGIVGENTRGENKYGPPCPPDREHRYFFKLYALDLVLNISKTSEAKDLTQAMQGHILAEAQLIGKYQRK